jgi:cysteine desulfurase
MDDIVYLDYAATTPVDRRVVMAMEPYYSEFFGNPSSIHWHGQRAEAAVEDAREKVARVLGCNPAEIVFTSCGSESDNLALRGTAISARKRTGANQILTSRVEHHAVTKTAEQLEVLYGFETRWLSVDRYGAVNGDVLGEVLSPQAAVASVMYANNEIGTISPVAELAARCRGAGVSLHTDAVQAAAYLPLDVHSLGVDLMSLGGHKFYGPKGIGVLYVRDGLELVPSLTGGGQEGGLRAGTQNVAYIVGLAEALWLAHQEREARIEHVRPLRDQIIGTVLESIPDVLLTGSPDARLPNHASFAMKDVDGNLLLTMLDAEGFACSSGSACKTGNPEPSEVMGAIGLPREWGLGSLRVTVGMNTLHAQVEAFLAALPHLVEKARSLSRAH